MPLLAKQHTPIPELDLLSWFFDEPRYDIDKPVWHIE
jgi:4-coumarate--CoA ligase